MEYGNAGESVTDKLIALSGGFDVPHVGHLRMIKDAAKFGKVIVLLNSDEWLERKKGYYLMPFHERKELLEGLRDVHCVLPASDMDGTVCASLISMHKVINYFGNGGDRKAHNTPEVEICDKFGIQVIYGLGGNKVQSSTNIAEKAAFHA